MKPNPIEAEQICMSAEQALRHGSTSLKQFPGLLRRIMEERLWERRLVPGMGTVELKNLRDLIVSKPRKGWGDDPAKIEAVIRDDVEVLAMWREAMKVGQGNRTDLRNNVTEVEEPLRGGARAYTLSRLKREALQLFAKVRAGELSANAAAIKAGFRVRTVTVPVDVDRAVGALRRAFTAEEVERLGRLLLL